MKKINIALKNCHGIRDLSTVLDFKGGRSIAIYAPNGTMKTSFARTFREFAATETTVDQIFSERTTVRSITDEAGAEIRNSDVVVILSYDEELEPSESTSTLLVNAPLRKEYESLSEDLLSAQSELVQALKTQSGTRQDVIQAVSRAFTNEPDNFLLVLASIHAEVLDQDDAPFAEFPYDLAFNGKVLPLLKKPEFRNALADYVRRLTELLEDSRFFSQESFNYYNASNVTRSLGDNGFFTANHAVLLRSKEGDTTEISDKVTLDSLIKDEKQKISDDDLLRKSLGEVEKALNKNLDTREFSKYLDRHTELLDEFADISLFEKRLWKSYLKKHEALFKQVVDRHHATESRKREIEQRAVQESTQWQRVIDIFNERFFVPFRLVPKNHGNVILGQEKILRLEFDFEEGADRATVERSQLLQALSNGEKKAFYILNVLFDVEARKKSPQETLFIIDDIADSFDYKNKYAIIHYLAEMSEQENFKLIILTHNFDFFRTLESRGVVHYKNCLMAQKNNSQTVLNPATGIRNPFIRDFKGNFFVDPMKRIACIPFARNILEYTKGDDDPDYLTLTALLHWKPQTASITQEEFDIIFSRTFDLRGTWDAPKESVLELITDQAMVALKAGDGANFENKIVLSIAIRLLAERHMVHALNDPEHIENISENQTHHLHGSYRGRKLGSVRDLDILDSVVLMTPENIHLNSFMYEPIIDMSDAHLRKLFADVRTLSGS